MSLTGSHHRGLDINLEPVVAVGEKTINIRLAVDLFQGASDQKDLRKYFLENTQETQTSLDSEAI